MKKAPCKGCGQRHEGCHVDCKWYIEWKKEKTEINEKRKLEKSLHSIWPVKFRNNYEKIWRS